MFAEFNMSGALTGAIVGGAIGAVVGLIMWLVRRNTKKPEDDENPPR